MSNYTKEQIEERIKCYTEKLANSKTTDLLKVYENLLKFWQNQKPNKN